MSKITISVRFWALFTMLTLCAGLAKATPIDSVNMKSKLPPEVAKLASEIKDIKSNGITMPDLPLDYDKDHYLNTTSVEDLKKSLKGKVVLVDIWDYTCINCIQTLPYLESWYLKYKDMGLVIIGVHSPEFEFEKDVANLKSAVGRFGISFPVIADNDFKLWQALSNQYWPAKYLFDETGTLRATHFGEGDYQSFEAFVQKLLIERDSSVYLPELTPAVRETDKPGAVCYKTTPETYVGYSRGEIGNPGGVTEETPTTYRLPAKLDDDKLYLDGRWTVLHEYAQPAGGVASLVISYQAKEANLVIHPVGSGGFKVWVAQDGLPIPAADRGTDIQEEQGKTYILVDEPRMYNITNNAKFNRHTLRISADTPNFGAHSFTFTTACE